MSGAEPPAEPSAAPTSSPQEVGARRALAFSFLDRYAALTLSIVSSMVIARLLTPADIGVFSVTMVFIMFISSMRDLGAGQYLIQERQLNPARIRATWTVLLGTGWLMGLLTLALSVPVSRFFNEPRMIPIMWVIALNFAVNPLGSLTYAWMMREMRFDALALMRFSASLAGAVTSVACAYKGLGPISLAYGNLMATLVNATVSLRYRPDHFGWQLGTSEIRRVVSYGGKITATNLVLDVAIGAPEFLLGKLQGLTSAGLYSRGNGLVSMFQKLVMDATQSVAIPLFAKSQRESGEFSEALMRGLSYVTALGWSFFIGLALMGHPIVRLLYGDQWDGAVDLMRLLAIGTAVSLPSCMCPHALMASGRAGKILRVSLLVVPIQVLCVGAGAWHSLEGAGIGFIASQILIMPIWLRACERQIGLPWRTFARSLWPSAVLALVTSLVPLGFMLALDSGSGPRSVSNLLSVLGCALCGVTVFVLASNWLGHPIYREAAVIRQRFFGRVRSR